MHRVHAQDAHHVLRVDRALRQRRARLHPLALRDLQPRRRRNVVLPRVVRLEANRQPPRAAPTLHHPIDPRPNPPRLRIRLLLLAARQPRDDLPRLHQLPVLHQHPRARRQLVVVAVHVVRRDPHLAQLALAQHLRRAVDLRNHRLPLRRARLEQLLHPRQTGRDVAHPRHAAGVERAHRQLRARLADALRRDDPHRRAQLHQLARRQRLPVAQPAQPVRAAADHRRAHVEAAHALLDQPTHRRPVQQRVRLGQHLARLRIGDRRSRVAARHPLVQRLQNAVVVDPADPNARHRDPARRAVFLADDHILRHIDQPPRQIAAVRRAQRRIGQTLARPVRRDEILQHREPVAEGRANRQLDDPPRGVRHQPAHARHLPHLRDVALRPARHHQVHRAVSLQLIRHQILHLLRRIGPHVDRRLVALLVRHQTAAVVVADHLHPLLRVPQQAHLLRRRAQLVDRKRRPRARRVLKPDRLDPVRHPRRLVAPQLLVAHADQPLQLPLVQLHVDLAERHAVRHHLIEDHPPHRRLHQLPVRALVAHPNSVVQLHRLQLVAQPHLLKRRERPSRRAVPILVPVACRVSAVRRIQRQVVAAHHHVQRRRHGRLAVRGQQQIGRAQHHLPRLRHRRPTQRHMHRHLISVEVRVERRADQRVNLNRAAVHQHRLKRLDAQPVQRRRAVQQHRTRLHHILQHLPDRRVAALHEALRALDVRRQLARDQLIHQERLEQLQRHPPRQPALVQLQLRAHHNHRAARVVHPLAQQILAEAPLLALQHVREALQPVAAAARHRPAPPTVVDQRIHRFLQHPLLVADDDLRRAQLQQPPQPVVAVDHPTVEIVQIRGREAPAVELHHRAQIRRQHRQRAEEHPRRTVG